jgi:hypothetical protein
MGCCWLFASEDRFSGIFVGAGHALRLHSFLKKNSTPSGLWIIVDAFFVGKFDPYRVIFFLPWMRFLYGGLTPAGSFLTVLSAGISAKNCFVFNLCC